MGSISGGSLRVELKASGTSERPGKRGGVALGSGAVEIKVNPAANRYGAADVRMGLADEIGFPGTGSEVEVLAGSPLLGTSYSITDFEGVPRSAMTTVMALVVEVMSGAVYIKSPTGDVFTELQAGDYLALGGPNDPGPIQQIRAEASLTATRLKIYVIGK